MFKFLKNIYWQLYIIRLSLRWVFRFNLGDRVLYNGKVCTLFQGVRAPVWELACGKENYTANESEFRKLRTFSNYYGSFKSGYRFYRSNWLSIWKREGIKPWMLGGKIWAGKPPKPSQKGGAV